MSSVRVTYTGICGPRPEVMLPVSKSISARQMVLAAHFNNAIPRPDKDACEDLRNLYEALTTKEERVNVGESGTAYRFILPVLAHRYGRHLLTGSPRLLQRPVTPLAEALRRLGAKITVTPEGLLIEGGELQGGRVRIDASESSQYVSSLMLLAPTLPGGLIIEMTGQARSLPYIDMTAAILRDAGISVSIDAGRVTVGQTAAITLPRHIERDWSAASCFFEVMALTGRIISMPGLGGTLQGDSRGARLFAELRSSVNMCDVPDLVPAYAATLCGLGKPFNISGIGHLRYKESDRLKSVSGELRKLGYDVRVNEEGLTWDGTRLTATNRVEGHNDHRIVMSMAPLAAVAGAITINDAGAVAKSFPDYFTQLAKTGYKIEKL